LKKFRVDQLRNIALISHGGAGKTSLAEALLYDAGVIDRLGRVDDAAATMDHDAEEQRRKISISASTAPLEWQDHKVNIIDTPGYFDFLGEVKASLRVADGAVVLVDAVAGVEVGTELTWRYADEFGLARMVVINKMDRENASFAKALASLKATFGAKCVPVQLPIGAEAGFKGVIDLITGQALVYDGTKAAPKVGEVPADLADEFEEARMNLVEAAAEGDDALLMKYLDGAELTGDEIRSGLRAGCLAGKVVPVACASSLRNVGVHSVLDVIVASLPSPAEVGDVSGVNPKTRQEVSRRPADNEPFSALVYKTMADPYVGKLTLFRVYSGILRSDSSAYNANKGRTERVGQIFAIRGKTQEPIGEAVAGDLAAVAKLQETTTGDTLCVESDPVIYKATEFPSPVFSVAVQPKSKGDEEKIGTGLNRLAEEDPTFRVSREPSTNELLISGMGELHLEVMTDRMRRKFGADVVLETPKVPYRETIRGSARVQGRHKKQTGGRGQFGDVWIEFETLPSDQEFEFVDKVFGGSVPRQYIPAVEKGLREALAEGVLAGYPTIGFRATLYDGSYHAVDSSEMAFKIAASLAFKKGMAEANPVLLEPIGVVEVLVPDNYMGDVIGDLNKKRGRILGMETQGSVTEVRAQVPMSEMRRYAIDLRSITQGRGTFQFQIDRYEEVPGHISQAVVEEARKRKEQEA
jgi:elongation factor G